MSSVVSKARARQWPAAPLAVFAACLLWAALWRLPFLDINSTDEPFFVEVARQWLDGRLPYVRAFDVKPPGLFAIFTLAQSILGDGVAAIRMMTSAADALSASGLFFLGRRCGGAAAGVWAAALYPVIAALVVNNAAYSALVAFIVLAFLAAIVSDGRDWRLLAIAGLCMGYACAIKQTSALEAIALLGLIYYHAENRAAAVRAGVIFCVSGSAPPLAFLAYFAAHGAAGAMIADVVFAAVGRANGAPEGIGLMDGALRFLPLQKSIVVVLALAALGLARLPRLRQRLPGAPLAWVAVWLLAGSLEVILQHASYESYLTAIIPPMLLMSGAVAQHGLDELGGPIAPRWRLPALGIAALASSAAFQLSNVDYREDMPALKQTAAALSAAHPGPDDRLLVVNRSMWLYTMSGMHPPTPFFHPMHTLCDFPAGGETRLADALAAKPRFIVLADMRMRFVCERDASRAEVKAALAASYRHAGHFAGQSDSFDVYELAKGAGP